MSQFIESIKVTPSGPLLLELHQRRVKATFEAFDCPCTLELSKVLAGQAKVSSGRSKLRVVYDLQGHWHSSLEPYSPVPISGFQLIECPEISYQFKSADRELLQNLSAMTKPLEPLITQGSQLTDSSFSNLVFFKDGIWYTPSRYLLNGVQRQFLLSKGTIREAKINLSTLRTYSHFALINALNSLAETQVYPLDSIRNLPIEY